MIKITTIWGFVEDEELPQENSFFDCITEEHQERMLLYYSKEEKKFFLDHNKTFEVAVHRWAMHTEEEEL